MAATESAKSSFDVIAIVSKARKAQKKFTALPEEKVNEIFKAAALAVDQQALPLAQLAVRETGMGSVEDKIFKNRFAAEFTYNGYRNLTVKKESDETAGLFSKQEPIGVLGAVISPFDPVSTAVYLALLSIKTGDAIVFVPAKETIESTGKAVEAIAMAVEKAGGPSDLISFIPDASSKAVSALISACDKTFVNGALDFPTASLPLGKTIVSNVLHTVPVVIDGSADLEQAASGIIHSKSFDNGLHFSAEQNVFVVKDAYLKFREYLARYGAFFLAPKDLAGLRTGLFTDGKFNKSLAGKTPREIGKALGIDVPLATRVLVAEMNSFAPGEILNSNKLCPLLTLYKVDDFDEAVKYAQSSLGEESYSQVAVIYVNPHKAGKIKHFAKAVDAIRILVNTPAAQGSMGAIYNTLKPCLMLDSESNRIDGDGKSLPNDFSLTKSVVLRQERKPVNDSFLAPKKLFVGKDALKNGLDFVRKEMAKGLIVLAFDAKGQEYKDLVVDRLGKGAVKKDGVVFVANGFKASALRIASALKNTKAKTVVAVGSDEVFSAAKLGRVMLANPKVDLKALTLPYLTPDKRIEPLPLTDIGLVTVATDPWSREGVSQGLSYEDRDGIHRIFDKSLVPQVAIIDKSLLKTVTVADSESAYAALARALSAYISLAATPEIDKNSLKAAKAARKLFNKKFNKVHAIDLGLSSALAFSNTIGGISDGIARAISEEFGVSQDSALAVLLPVSLAQVFTDAPFKMGTSPDYLVPDAKRKLALFAKRLKLSGKSDDQLFESLKNWLDNLRVVHHLPTGLADLGITPAELKAKALKTAEKAYESQAILSSPSYPRIEGIKDLLLVL